MKRFLSLATVCLVATLPAVALDIPAGGIALHGNRPLTTTLAPSIGQSQALEGGGRRLMIQRPEASKAYAAQFTADCDKPISPGEPVLVVVKARTVGGMNQGVMVAKLQLRGSPYTALAPTTEFSVPHEWTEIPLTFIPSVEIPASESAVVQLLCGHKEQTLEVQSIQIHKYSSGTATASFPRIKRTYPGRDAAAPWRKAALDRIEKQRKADLEIQILGQDGSPLQNTEVQVTLIRHQFGFGTAVTAQHLTGTGPDDLRYQQIVDRYFSVVVFENDLKDGNWEPQLTQEQKTRRNQLLDASFAWLKRRDIPVRGHYLMQVPTPYNLHGVTDNALIRERVLSSVRERLAFVQDRVYEWDVINHPIAWSGADMLNKRPGLERLDEEVYRLARTATKLPFFVNEDQVFRPGPQHDETFAYIRSLQDKGLTIAGLGNQAHFSDSYLPSPEHLLAVTDHFSKIVPHQSITEFDIVTTEDEALAADFTRDILIATFSHPAYTSFLFWGFWEGSHWKPEAASWNRNWTIRKRGQVIEELLGNTWRTQLTLKTDAEGRLPWRGFPGGYEVICRGESRKVRLTQEEPRAVVKL